MIAASPQEAGSAEETPISGVLLGIASELERVRQLGWRVERATCGLAVLPGAALETLRELQNLDAMLQQLAALRDFLVALSGVQGRLPLTEVTSALERITLSDLQARLAGQPNDTSESDGAIEWL
jgi:hypothetical protein